MRSNVKRQLTWFLWVFPLWAMAQVTPSSTSNYVVEQTPRTHLSVVSPSTSYLSAQAMISYVDGLGRPLQSVQVRGSSNGNTDIVTQAITYDSFGRPSQSFLPVPGGIGGALIPSPQTSGQTFYGDEVPYNQTVYDSSPLNRTVQQWGTGQAWRTHNRSVLTSYRVAGDGTTSGVVRFKLNLHSNTIYANKEGETVKEYYGPNDIATRIVTDEQGNTIVEFTDLQGRMIRRDVYTGSEVLTTMYVYDLYERLGAVIPPKLYNWFVSGTENRILSFYVNGDPNAPDSFFKENAYAYLYDKRGRLKRKHVPSAGWTNYIYDWQDRPVMSQDQQDKAATKWRFTRYDGVGRTVSTGQVSSALSASQLQTDFDNAQVTNESFPTSLTLTDQDLLTQSFYDTYSGSPFSYVSTNSQISPITNTIGLLTRSGERNLETGAWYDATYWYDTKGRVIQNQKKHHLGGTDQTDFQYTFDGEPIQKVLVHKKTTSTNPISLTTVYELDHLNRRIQLSCRLGNDPLKILAKYSYDDVGRLREKRLEPGIDAPGILSRSNTPANYTQDVYSQYIEIIPRDFDLSYVGGSAGYYEARIGGGSALQVLDYRYNIRGWLLGINSGPTGEPVLNSLRKDVFAFGLDYETQGLFNGNIGRQRWRSSQQTNLTRHYFYTYDGANRLTNSSYVGEASEQYTLSNLNYDANGNITSLRRGGESANFFDNLTYTYGSGNQLLKVSDASLNSDGFNDINPASAGDDYSYWPDGSLKKDLNRSISEIQYNLLKLPKQINQGTVHTFDYSATGEKLKQVSGSNFREYVGPFQYQNGSLFEVAHEEGRIVPVGTTYRYEYYLRDHLSNVRGVVSNVNSLSVHQWIDYDPWGLELSAISSTTATSNRLHYNGKESLTELGNGLLDYGARFYDATIGRWGVVDPLADKAPDWSVFRYGFNNPVSITDPDGQFEMKDGRVIMDSWEGYGNVESSGSTSGRIDPNAQEPSPKPAQLARNAQERLIQSQAETQRLIKRGDGIEPNYFIESQAIGGAVFKPVGLLMSSIGRRFLNLFGTKNIVQNSEGLSRSLVNLTEETFSQALFKGSENIGGYSVYGTKGLVGSTFNRNIFLIEAAGSKSLSGLRSLIGTLESEALGTGANKISIYGSSVINKGFLNPSIAQRFGYTFEQSGSGVFLQKTLKP